MLGQYLSIHFLEHPGEVSEINNKTATDKQSIMVHCLKLPMI